MFATDRRKPLFIMLNPSTADETKNDPTIRRCIGYAEQWGYAGVEICNIFAWRSTDPEALYRTPDPIGLDNDYWIKHQAMAAVYAQAPVICAWGKHGALHRRGHSVMALLRAIDARPKALRVNGDGSPGHPLYLPASAALIDL